MWRVVGRSFRNDLTWGVPLRNTSTASRIQGSQAMNASRRSVEAGSSERAAAPGPGLSSPVAGPGRRLVASSSSTGRHETQREFVALLSAARRLDIDFGYCWYNYTDSI